jgi:hypothetical protein
MSFYIDLITEKNFNEAPKRLEATGLNSTKVISAILLVYVTILFYTILYLLFI